MSLQVKNVNKYYGKKLAVNQVSFDIEPNRIYGILGRNGAGKSTLLNMINNRLSVSSGEILLDNQPLLTTPDMLRRVYLTSDEDWFYPDYKIKRIFNLAETLYGSFDWEFANDLCNAFDLDITRKLKAVSTGYRSIAKLIVALCVPCDYVFLDEPVLGLDANHRILFNKKLLVANERRQRTFIISTHIIEEVAYLLQDVIIIDNGEIIIADSADNLTQMAKSVAGNAQLVDEFTRGMSVIGNDYLGGLKQSVVLGDIYGQIPEGLTVTPVKLQDLFIHLTKREGEQ
ncbi:ABC transporter ATP-binding protein [Carnobacteriaceae bacterium zg-ZUI252]|nr:ABC transporter ATP-binding protein [Carnobacteriaceae bacterium zg-ZUI252]